MDAVEICGMTSYFGAPEIKKTEMPRGALSVGDLCVSGAYRDDAFRSGIEHTPTPCDLLATLDLATLSSPVNYRVRRMEK